MPAPKPRGLITRAETKAAKQARADAESAMKPGRGLPANPPARLNGHETAAAVWRRLMRMYGELEATVVTRLDQDLLIDYCILTEQTAEMDDMRRAAYQVWADLKRRWDAALADKRPVDVIDEAVDRMQIALAEAVKLDGRVDRKRALLLQWRQSLYLTPRARAGAAPEQKAPPEVPDEMEKLLGEVSQFVNERGSEGDK